ncbi:MAG: hypothetical protein WBP85_13130 [Terracidiphilus sp.]
MNGTILLRKLIAIERLIGKAEDDTLRNLLYDAEDYLIQMQSVQGKSFFRDALCEEQGRLELIG